MYNSGMYEFIMTIFVLSLIGAVAWGIFSPTDGGYDINDPVNFELDMYEWEQKHKDNK